MGRGGFSLIWYSILFVSISSNFPDWINFETFEHYLLLVFNKPNVWINGISVLFLTFQDTQDSRERSTMWWPFRPSSPGKEGGTTPTSVLQVGVTTAASVTWPWTERTSLLSTWTVASTRANTLITRSRRKSNSNKKWLAENRRCLFRQVVHVLWE